MRTVRVDLSDGERALLRWGLLEWGGPAYPTEALARVMGFESLSGLHDGASSLARRIMAGDPLTPDDWTRALVATEIVWASDVYGSGLDAMPTSGLPDAEAVEVLRSLQRKLGRANAITRPR